MLEVVAEGGCFCGSVRYQVGGQPSVSMICHCNSCARASGSPAVAWVTFPVERFSFVRGNPTEFHSSPPVTRGFCGSCGTALTYEHAERATEIDVTTRSLDDPNLFPPTHHSWVSDAPLWSRPAGEIPAYKANKADS